MDQSSLKDSKAYIFGIEGELIDSEQINFDKWKEVAQRYDLVQDEVEFQNLWKGKLVGIGDKAIYEVFAQQSLDQKGTAFISWSECKTVIQKHYEDNLYKAKVPPGLKEAIERARHEGKGMVIATHAHEELTKAQLDFLRINGVDMSDVPVIYGERKEADAYVKAFEVLQKSNPGIKREDVIVFDSSPAYILRAQELGMKTAHIKHDYPEYLRQHTATRTIRWSDLARNLVVVASLGVAKVAAIISRLQL